MAKFGKKKGRLIVLGVAVMAILVGVTTVSVRKINISKINRGEYTTAEITIGNVTKTVGAKGETVSENEVLILSPGNGIVEKVLRLPGTKVTKGEVVLTLDQTELKSQLEDAEDQLGLLNNNLEKLRLSAKNTRIDLEHDIQVKKLKIASLKAELNDQEELLEVGGISQAKIDKTKQELVLAEKELERSSQKHRIRLKQLTTDEKGLLLQISMKEKQITQKQELVAKMIVRSPGTGVVLEVRAREGENKKKNELLVRISEHTRLKVEGEIPEKQGWVLRNGGKVYVVVGKDRLPGVVGNIKPELKDDKIIFDVFLDNPNNDKLKINQGVDLLVVRREKNNVLRVKKGEYFTTKRSQCNVVENDQILSREIETGLCGMEYIEIVGGLDSGDVVINSEWVKTKKKSQTETAKGN